MHKLVVTSNT